MNSRNPVKAMDRILNDCTHPELANAETNAYSSSRNDVTGPSIRLAEAFVQG